MTQKTYKRISLLFTLIVTISIFGLTFWDYFHGGVPGHHLLKREDLPEISNWWGLLSLPLLSYFAFERIEKRIDFKSNITYQTFLKKHIAPFIIALFYGILIVVFSSTENSKISYSMFLILFLVALFIPIYKSEYFLGFVLGLSYTFGGALPVIISLVLATVFYLLFNYLRPVFVFIGTKIGFVKNNV